MTVVYVLGDSVPFGERTDADPWPRRLDSLVDGVGSVELSGGMGRTLVSFADDPGLDALLGTDSRGAADETVVLVHAGHNDAQTSGGEPRVTRTRFADGAATLDRTLAEHPGVDRHAFVGLVPLLQLDAPGSVPFGDDQPDRSLSYDALLADRVREHLPVGRPVDDWIARTADGVHPNGTGHAFLAERVAAWLTG